MALLVKVGLLELRNTVPRRSLNPQRAEVELGFIGPKLVA